MKLIINCPFCSWSSKIKGLEPSGIGSYQANTDSNIFVYDCWPEKHVSVIYFYEKKFEILFESGLRAINDYYYREAVASLSAALERFYEYCIQLILLERIDNKIFNKTWKYISNQSERQLGAFIFVFLQAFNTLPSILDTDSIGFRNKVIHKGYFPDLKETELFLHNIFRIISNNLSVIKSKQPDSIVKFEDNFKKKIHTKAKNKIIELKSEIKNKSYVLVSRPFNKKIPNFLSQIFIRKLEINELDEYIRNIENEDYRIK